MLTTIKAKLVFFSLISIVSVALSLTFSYLIAASSIRTLMKNDVTSVADAMARSINFISRVNPDAVTKNDFKEMVNSIRIGTNGHSFLVDELGTLVVHPSQQGKNLAGQPHIDLIRNHKEGGLLEFSDMTTEQRNMAAYRYVDTWHLWVVHVVDEADYFHQLKSAFLKWNLIFAGVIIAMLACIGVWIDRTVTNPLRRMLRTFRTMGGDDMDGPAQPPMDDCREAREVACRLLGKLLYSKHLGLRR